jgi:hypothetical protein
VGAATLVQTITPPTYHAGTEELVAVDLLNAKRLRCGSGALAHAGWQILNGTTNHHELAGTTGLTGLTLVDRAAAAGYTPMLAFSESLAFGIGANKSGRGAAGLRELFSTPYHAATLLGPYAEVGISVLSPVDVGLSNLFTVTEVNPGARTAYQLLASKAVATYPCDGVAGVNFRRPLELPNPVQKRSLAAQPLGHPVSVVVRFGNTLVITPRTWRDKVMDKRCCFANP